MRSTTVVAIRVPITTRTLIEVAALEQDTSRHAWMKETLRRAALEQLTSDAVRPDGKAEPISA